ncbi:MAG: hypothetical protein AAB967_03140, partial [Patescibacteria group bacterium]
MPRLLKPKLLEDIRSSRESSFRVLEGRVNLHYKRSARVPLADLFKGFAAVSAIFFLIMGSVHAPGAETLAAPVAGSKEEREAREIQLKALEG